MVQEDKHADEHVQDFEKAAMDADYNRYPLIVEFKCSLNPALYKWLTELRPMPVMIIDWYREVVTLDWQFRVVKAEDAFFNKVNTGTSVRFPQTNNNGQQQQSGQTYPQNTWNWKPALTFPPPQQQVAPQSNKPEDPNTMNVDRNRQWQRLPVKCYNCNGKGHFARDCQAWRRVRQLTFDEVKDLYKQMNAARKDCEEIAKKAKEQKDFPNATQWKHLHWSCKTNMNFYILQTIIVIATIQ